MASAEVRSTDRRAPIVLMLAILGVIGSDEVDLERPRESWEAHHGSDAVRSHRALGFRRDWDRLVAYDAFPQEHWKHLRTTDRIPVCRGAAPHVRGEALQESRQCHDADLENFTRRRTTFPQTERPAPLYRRVRWRRVSRRYLHRDPDSRTDRRLTPIYTPIDKSSASVPTLKN
jgi:hypothetical protein